MNLQTFLWGRDKGPLRDGQIHHRGVVVRVTHNLKNVFVTEELVPRKSPAGRLAG